MTEAKVVELADEVAVRAKALKDEIKTASPDAPPFGTIYAVRRTLETLEDEMRQGTGDTLGDAC